MKRAQLIESVAERAGISKAQAQKIVHTVFGVIAHNLTEGDGELQLTDFGTFQRKDVPERTARNPRTGEKITVEAHTKITFKPSATMPYYTRKHQ